MKNLNYIGSSRPYLWVVILALANALFFVYTADISIDDLKEKYTNEESEFIEVDGMQVHYRDEGVGVPVVLLHGTASSLHTWDGWTEKLKENYRVIRLDLPAFGLTGPRPEADYRIETYARFLDNFLDTVGIDSLYLAGNSLGGNIAWYYAARHPEKIKKLVLVDPSGFMQKKALPWVFKLARTPVLNSIIKYFTPKSLIENNLKQVYYDKSKITPLMIDRYYNLTLRTGNRQAFIDRAKTDMKDQSAMLKSLDVPTLILWGKEDSWIPVSDGELFEANMPNAELVVLEKAGHVPMEEKPAESLEPVLKFFTN